ncbi:putative reverse transcriptase (RNA-dependent DNA polymerase) [Lyophyllum shimeji]|uniref:Reverse transcriptase (RNA-dependent DNA polymerase) n=1 Tax=Lyophyllum shimeji TaxID=47721 RepID=A0A9P3PZH3_LYOSH|nr:putative reverse transcriptase (RNA-dependent DNA polymerase) [Lyophyllum shimeji]
MLVLDERGVIGKLDPKSRQFIFTGLSDESRAWRYFNPGARRIQTSRNVIFPADITDQNESISGGIDPLTLEGSPIRASSQRVKSNQKPNAAAIYGNVAATVERHNVRDHHQNPPSRIPSAHPASPLSRQSIIDCSTILRLEDQGNGSTMSRIPLPATPATSLSTKSPISHSSRHDHEEPTSWRKRSLPTFGENLWRSELDQLKRLGTFEVVDLPPEPPRPSNPNGLESKRDGSGKFLKAKSRLVAKGFTQQPGWITQRPSPPVVRMDSLRLLLVLAAAYKLKIHVVDMVAAYLNSTLQEKFTLRNLPGLGDGTKRVWRLLKTIYGLKQSGPRME